jgi:hypothetical protein
MQYLKRWASVAKVMGSVGALLALGGAMKGGCSDVYASASKVESLERQMIDVHIGIARIESKLDTVIDLAKGKNACP